MTTLEIKYQDIPLYLQAGEFYRSLDYKSLEDLIEVPANCLKVDDRVEDVADLTWLIRTAEFWILDEIPRSMIEYCKVSYFSRWGPVLLDLPNGRKSEISSTLLALCGARAMDLHRSIIYNENNNDWDAIVLTVDCMSKSEMGTTVACEAGHLRLLKLLHDREFSWHAEACAAASSNGHLECLQYAHENGCPWDFSVYTQAAKKGHLSCLKYAHHQGLEWHPDACAAASGNGQLECLQYARESGCPWDFSVYTLAAQNGHISCLKYARLQGLEWHTDACAFAAFAGQLMCLEYLYYHDCPWDESTVTAAARNGHLDCLQFALYHGCPVDLEACNLACMNGHLRCLKALHEYGVLCDEDTTENAALYPDAACLRYLHQNGCPWDEGTIQLSAERGNFLCLKYAFEMGCAHDDAAVHVVSVKGSMQCLKYVVEDQLLCLDELDFTLAILRGDLSCVQYLVDQGCPRFIDPFNADHIELCNTFFEKNNAEFVQCIERALDSGWTPSEHFMRFVFECVFENCRELMEREGWYDKIPNLPSPIPLPSTVTPPDESVRPETVRPPSPTYDPTYDSDAINNESDRVSSPISSSDASRSKKPGFMARTGKYLRSFFSRYK